MKTINNIKELRSEISKTRQQGKTIAFVPTMGNLHAGHISLIKHAKQEADYVVASIFVNPMQFGANEDLDNYPRTMTADQEKLSADGTDLLFAPSASEIYPEGMDLQTQVSVPNITDSHCGASRPGHFTGVSTVVSKLFNIVQADIAVFGEKDFQQLAVIRKMCRDLCMPIKILGIATGRAEDGLALSSRNGYLSNEERQIAPSLYQILQDCQDKIATGERDFSALERDSIVQISKQGFQVDYFSICDSVTLKNITGETEEIVILVAAFLGNTRLIDNVTISLKR